MLQYCLQEQYFHLGCFRIIRNKCQRIYFFTQDYKGKAPPPPLFGEDDDDDDLDWLS